MKVDKSKAIDEILKNNSSVPFDDLFSDDHSNHIANIMLESEVTTDEMITELCKKKSVKRISKVAIDDSLLILKELHALDEKTKLSKSPDIVSSPIFSADSGIVYTALLCADIAGCMNIKSELYRLFLKLTINICNEKANAIVNKTKIISEDRSNAKKGKVNRHNQEAMDIARHTWEKHPNASLAGLADEIYIYLHAKWNDVPVAGTIKKWLKESEMNPDVKPKNRNFKLVLTKGA
ncbi:hypothetical protein OZQ94_001202 [Salmonella enterica subsp. enterica]|nr:hypothetical protein [Salmonella enterica subsp. enterica]